VYLPLLWISVRVALSVALAATLLAFPLAYFLVFRAGLRAPLLLTLLILPFWTSYLLRIIAWKIILGTDGVINSLLISLGLVSDPVPILIYSRLAVVITLVYVWLPFVALPIYAALQRIDRSLLEAATILGAPPWFTFLRVTLPLSLPGVIAGFVMVFIPTVGEFVTPLLVGGSRGALYGNIVELFFGDGINWPLGSAMALIMLVGMLALFAVAVRLVDLRRFIG
jgi:spermidine/putrescine transport system permease protein